MIFRIPLRFPAAQRGSTMAKSERPPSSSNVGRFYLGSSAPARFCRKRLGDPIFALDKVVVCFDYEF